MPSPFEVLAVPLRRRILDELLEQPRTVGELVASTGAEQTRVSKHLRVLREAGMVRVTAEAQYRRYELCPEPLAEVDDWLAPYLISLLNKQR